MVTVCGLFDQDVSNKREDVADEINYLWGLNAH